MNWNVVIAVLEVKGILTHDEATRLVEHLNSTPQSTFYADALEAVKRLTDKPAQK